MPERLSREKNSTYREAKKLEGYYWSTERWVYRASAARQFETTKSDARISAWVASRKNNGEGKVETGELPEFDRDMSESPLQLNIKVFLALFKSLTGLSCRMTPGMLTKPD